MKRYDDIDQLFRNRLGVEGQESSDWLTPPPFILDNAAKIVNERRKKRRRGFVILFIGMLAAGFIALQFIGLNFGSDTITEPSYSARLANSKLLNSETRLGAPLSKASKGGLKEAKQPEILSSAVSPKVSGKQTRTNNVIAAHNALVDKKAPVVNSFTLPADKESEARTTKAFKVEKRLEGIQLGRIEQIKKIDRIKESNLIWERPLVIKEQQAIEHKTEEDPKALLLYAFVGSNLSTLHMSNVTPSDFELTEYDNFYLGFQLGVGSNYQISKRLSIAGSVSFNSFINKSSYTRNELYDKANEEIEQDGSVIYKASFDISTPLTETSKDFIIDVDDYSVQQDHILVKDTEIKERINVLKTTLGLSYTLASFNRMSISVGAGLSANSVFKLNNHYKSTVLYEDKKMMEAEFESEDRAGLKKFFLSSNVSAGVEYSINQKWSAIFNAGYERSIGSIRKQNPSDPTQTMLGSISLNVGMRHLF